MSESLKVVAIIQARLGSTRLPSKSLKLVHERTLFEHIVERVAASRCIDEIALATTRNASDDALTDCAQRLGLRVHRGSEEDVLERFYGAAVEFGAGLVVRITADDPFKDPEVIDRAVGLALSLRCDYCSNTLQPSFPEGIDVEVIRFDALQFAHQKAALPSEREHVTPFIWKQPHKFSLHNFTHVEDLSHLRWTVDYEEDLMFARRIYSILYPRKKIFLMKDILDALAANAELNRDSAPVVRNEGYFKSLQKDSAI